MARKGKTKIANEKKKARSIALIIELVVLSALLLLLFFQFKSFNNKSVTQLASTATAPLLRKVLPQTQPKVSSPAAQPIAQPIFIGRSVRIPILMYHYIGNNPNPADKARDALSTAPDKFDAQLGYLASAGYTPITFDTMYSALKGGGSLPSKPIILTFDDGYVDFYVNAFPILRKYGFRAVSFIPTGLMNQGYYLTWSEIKEMQSSGLISFEAHSVTHANLALLSGDRLRNEIIQSKSTLESEIGEPVNFFAYPYGTSNPITWQAVKAAGYAGAVGTWYGLIESEGTQYNWPRVRIAGGISLEDFKKKF